MVTHEFILADYIDIILHTRVKPDSGPHKGMLIDGPDRPVQRFRLIPQNISPQSGARYDATQQGTATFSQVLLGDWDCQMEIYDWWQHPETGQLFEITTPLWDNGYEKKGMVLLYDRAK
jgi:hypothetical protein